MKIGWHEGLTARAAHRTIIAGPSSFHAKTCWPDGAQANEILRDHKIANDLYCFHHKSRREGNLKVQVLRQWFSCITRCYTWPHEDFYD
ncbi:hypothetical protein [Pseudoduganella rhizocola]|uniref:hypothetical protein n=1 Tax=Pseudoduganella rhizocola TaxID=3382643 RepID=UPI0038B44500